jgi:RNA polymerase sigma factor (TIGR02999 family)
MSDVTEMLKAAERGDEAASEQLLVRLYDELRALAAGILSRERPGQTLQPTALVHEAYLRLVSAGGPTQWQNHRHFFAAAARSMRRIVVEHARRKRRPKHGGDLRRVPIHGQELVVHGSDEQVLAVDEALSALAEESPEKARLVELRAFGGLTLEEAAETLGISRATASRHWSYARAWLFDYLRDSADDAR